MTSVVIPYTVCLLDEANTPPVRLQMSKVYKIYTMAVCRKNVSVVKKGAPWDNTSSCRRGLKAK